MSRPHAAALVEDAVHRRSSTLLLARGWRPRTISHVGYGSPDFVRVFGRVVLGRHQDEPAASDARASLRELHGAEEEQRGWRAFVTSPAMGVPVKVTAGDREVRTRSDRGGHVDIVVRATTASSRAGTTSRSRRQGTEPVAAASVDRRRRHARAGQRHRRHGDHHDAAAADDRGVEHLRAARAGPARRARHGADVPAAAGGRPGCADRLRLDRRLEHRADAEPLPRGTATPSGRCCSPTGGRPTPAGSAAARSTSGRRSTGWPGTSRRSAGCSSATTASTTPDLRRLRRGRPEAVDAIGIRQLTPTEQVLSHGIPVSNEEFAPRGRRPVPISAPPTATAS